MSKPDNPFACAWCDEAAHIRQGRVMLCATHYRISSMRARAARDGKMVPTRDEIASLAAQSMTCVGCKRPMNWLRSSGTSTQVTLQHDRDGTIRLLCLACNTRHAQHPGDSFYTIPAAKKWCPDCGDVLPKADFCRDLSRPLGLKSYCRKCSAARHHKWRIKHANA